MLLPDPNDRQSPQDIEAMLDRDRAALAHSLHALQDRMSLDSLARDAVALLLNNAEPCLRAVDKAVRANPLAVGLTCLGLAWLVLGSDNSADRT